MYEVYYNVGGVLPVRNFFTSKEEADQFATKVRMNGFRAEIIHK